MRWSLQCVELERWDYMTDNNPTKKIILLLVEGPTDEDALALVYSRLLNFMLMEIIKKHGTLL